MAPSEVPIKFFDFSRWLLGDTVARAVFAQEVCTEFMETGFIRITNHGISQPLISRNRQLMQRFFVELTEEQRMRYYDPASDGQVGYTPLDRETAVGAEEADHKHFTMQGDRYALPEIIEVPGYRDASLELFGSYRKLYIEFMQVVAQALGLLPNHFTPVLGNSSLRQIHYPLHNDQFVADMTKMLSVSRGGNVQGLCNEPHTDICALTLLFSSQPGLQLWYRNRWLPVPCSEESLVVNCGDMLEHYTNGRFKSGMHRVVCPAGAHRYSMPFFGHFEPDTSIVPLACFGEPDLKKFGFKTALEYLLFRLEQIKLREKAKVAHALVKHGQRPETN